MSRDGRTAASDGRALQGQRRWQSDLHLLSRMCQADPGGSEKVLGDFGKPRRLGTGDALSRRLRVEASSACARRLEAFLVPAVRLNPKSRWEKVGRTSSPSIELDRNGLEVRPTIARPKKTKGFKLSLASGAVASINSSVRPPSGCRRPAIAGTPCPRRFRWSARRWFQTRVLRRIGWSKSPDGLARFSRWCWLPARSLSATASRSR